MYAYVYIYVWYIYSFFGIYIFRHKKYKYLYLKITIYLINMIFHPYYKGRLYLPTYFSSEITKLFPKYHVIILLFIFYINTS